MNASFEQPPSSPSELAAGAVALGVVALITIFGVSTSPPGAAVMAAELITQIPMFIGEISAPAKVAPPLAQRPPPAVTTYPPPLGLDTTATADEVAAAAG